MVPLRFLNSGETMLVVEFGDCIDATLNERVLALDDALRTAALPGVVELTPTFRSLAIHYEPLIVDRAALIEQVLELEAKAEITTRESKIWTLPCCYEAPHGEDLVEVAARMNMTPARLIELHTSTPFRVHMYGFAPGFAYLGGLPDDLHVSRRNSPRAPHPANAIMIGGGMSAIASVPMPTGWWVIGRTPEKMFAPGRNPEFLVAVGDDIRFEPVNSATFALLEERCLKGEILARAEAKT